MSSVENIFKQANLHVYESYMYKEDLYGCKHFNLLLRIYTQLCGFKKIFLFNNHLFTLNYKFLSKN